ncbi:heparin lyase I family protein [Lysobacter capsici]|uniref:heparin lyase I family protein n=1 Tax=Lysobacter capsici TaxID=435897 RepID=UPI001BFFE1E1|nr:heparin lyase I family protein [Lysobacter capsici]QWF16219.1 polysaccharide lyase [Lysobacter capsici]
MAMEPIRALMTCCLIGLMVCAQDVAAQTPTLVADYETGTTDSGIARIETTAATAPDAVFVGRRYARSGLYSVGHKVNLDDPAYVSYGKPRSETATDRVPAALYRDGDHRLYSFSVLLDDWQDWTGGSTPLDIVWQFKHVNGAADFLIGVRRNQMVLRYGSRQIVLIDDIRPYDNRWIDFRFDILWSRNSDGYFIADMRLDTQADFTRKATIIDYPTFDPASAGQHGVLQWGLYRPDATTAGGAPLTRIVYHDDITVTAPPSPMIRLNKAFAASGRFNPTDQFTLSIAPRGPGQTVSADTAGTRSQVTSHAAVLIAPIAGTTYELSEAPASSAPGTSLSNYLSRYACTNANATGPAPRGDGSSFLVTVSAHDELSCTFTNTRNARADLAVAVTNTSAAGGHDQADDTVARDSTSHYRIVVSNHGPDAAIGAVVRSQALAGLSCAGPASCSGSACPAPTVPVDALRSGAVLGRLGDGEQVDLSLDCRVD